MGLILANKGRQPRGELADQGKPEEIYRRALDSMAMVKKYNRDYYRPAALGQRHFQSDSELYGERHPLLSGCFNVGGGGNRLFRPFEAAGGTVETTVRIGRNTILFRADCALLL